jgi:hypothetical protein
MTERKITIKGFIKKATNAKGAEGFLAQYREYLTTGEVASITSPIIAKIDNGGLTPETGLEDITNAVFAHMMVRDLNKAEESVAKASEPAITKPVLAKILSASGEELDSDSFHLHQDAERWVDNRLYSGYPGSHGEVIHTKLLIKGEPQTTKITREDSISRILRKPKGAATKRVGASSGRLGFGVRARQSHSHFSRG